MYDSGLRYCLKTDFVRERQYEIGEIRKLQKAGKLTGAHVVVSVFCDDARAIIGYSETTWNLDIIRGLLNFDKKDNEDYTLSNGDFIG